MVSSSDYFLPIWASQKPPSGYSDGGDFRTNKVTQQHSLWAQRVGITHQEPVHLEREQDLLHLESFVDGLVHDDPLPWTVGGQGDGSGLWEAPDAETPSRAAAKLFLPSLTGWLPSSSRHVDNPNGDLKKPMSDTLTVIPRDSLLDALLKSPASPEIVPTVTAALVTGSANRPNGSSARNTQSDVGFRSALYLSVKPQRPVDFNNSIDVSSCGDIPLSVAPASVPLAEGINTSLAPNSQKGLCFHYQGEHGLKEMGSDSRRGGEEGTATVDKTVIILSRAAGPRSESTESQPVLTGDDLYSYEYNDAQHTFLREQEVKLFVGPGYVAGPNLPGVVSPTVRMVLVDWLTQLHTAAPKACGKIPALSVETLFLAVNVMDRFLSTAAGAATASEGDLAIKLAAAAALCLASKYEDVQPPSMWAISMASKLGGGVGRGGGCHGECDAGDGRRSNAQEDGKAKVTCTCGIVRTRRELVAMEMRVASALKFRMTAPTALSFLGVFLRRAQGLGCLPSLAAVEGVREQATRMMLGVLRDASSLEHPPSALAAAALHWAFCITSPRDRESFAFSAVTGYNLHRVYPCLKVFESVAKVSATSVDYSPGRHVLADECLGESDLGGNGFVNHGGVGVSAGDGGGGGNDGNARSGGGSGGGDPVRGSGDFGRGSSGGAISRGNIFAGGIFAGGDNVWAPAGPTPHVANGSPETYFDNIFGAGGGHPAIAAL